MHNPCTNPTRTNVVRSGHGQNEKCSGQNNVCKNRKMSGDKKMSPMSTGHQRPLGTLFLPPMSPGHQRTLGTLFVRWCPVDTAGQNNVPNVRWCPGDIGGKKMSGTKWILSVLNGDIFGCGHFSSFGNIFLSCPQ
jgi:hypothetical protein